MRPIWSQHCSCSMMDLFSFLIHDRSMGVGLELSEGKKPDGYRTWGGQKPDVQEHDSNTPDVQERGSVLEGRTKVPNWFF